MTITTANAVDKTRALVARRAAGNRRLASVALARLEAGFERFGAASHLVSGDDWLQEALEELADAHNYLCFHERTGGCVSAELWRALAAAIDALLRLSAESIEEQGEATSC